MVRPKIVCYVCSVYLKSPGSSSNSPFKWPFSTGALHIQGQLTCLVRVARPLPDGLHWLNGMFLDGRLLVDGDLLEVDERMGVKGNPLLSSVCSVLSQHNAQSSAR